MSEDLEGAAESHEPFRLGPMLAIALAAILGTTLTVWIWHFANEGSAHSTPAHSAVSKVPKIAVLPFTSTSGKAEDLRLDSALTTAVVGGLARSSWVLALPESDVDPVAVGRDRGVKVMVIGMMERLGKRIRLSVRLVNTKDGSQIWAGRFEDDQKDLVQLSNRIADSVVARLTQLLD